jgi:hypothetical protein
MRRGHTVKEETASNKDIYFSVSVFRRGEDSNVFLVFYYYKRRKRFESKKETQEFRKVV